MLKRLYAAIALCGLGAMCPSNADTTIELYNPNPTEAGLWFVYAPASGTGSWLSLTYDPTLPNGGRLLGRGSFIHITGFHNLDPDSGPYLSPAYNIAAKWGGGKWGSLSDRRVKKDIRPFTTGLDAIQRLRPRTFKYDGSAPLAPGDGKDYIGLIAQEVRPVLPFMVHDAPKETVAPGKPMLALDSSAMTYVLINAVKEQAQMIRELEREARQLEHSLCVARKLGCGKE